MRSASISRIFIADHKIADEIILNLVLNCTHQSRSASISLFLVLFLESSEEVNIYKH